MSCLPGGLNLQPLLPLVAADEKTPAQMPTTNSAGSPHTADASASAAGSASAPSSAGGWSGGTTKMTINHIGGLSITAGGNINIGNINMGSGPSILTELDAICEQTATAEYRAKQTAFAEQIRAAIKRGYPSAAILALGQQISKNESDDAFAALIIRRKQMHVDAMARMAKSSSSASSPASGLSADSTSAVSAPPLPPPPPPLRAVGGSGSGSGSGAAQMQVITHDNGNTTSQSFGNGKMVTVTHGNGNTSVQCAGDLVFD